VKVCIAIPCLDYMASDFALSLAALCMKRAYDPKLRKGVDLALIHQTGSIIMEARNSLVHRAQEMDCTHIFFLDSDVVVPPNALERLISWHKPIVAASYVKRVEPHQLLGEQLVSLDGEMEETIPLNNMTAFPLKAMATIPLGCALISMKVFDSLTKPYFAYLTTPEGSMSEDSFFSHKARNAGFAIHLDTALTKEVGHVGSKVFRP